MGRDGAHRPIPAKYGPGLGRGRVLNSALYRETHRTSGWLPGSAKRSGVFAASFFCSTPFADTGNSKDLGKRFWRHHGIYQSDVGSRWRPSPGWNRRLPPTAPTRTREHIGRNMLSLIVPMSSGRLFLDGLLASIVRLCFTGTARVTWVFWTQPQTGHFYFASRRTFLLCPDRIILGLGIIDDL